MLIFSSHSNTEIPFAARSALEGVEATSVSQNKAVLKPSEPRPSAAVCAFEPPPSTGTTPSNAKDASLWRSAQTDSKLRTTASSVFPSQTITLRAKKARLWDRTTACKLVGTGVMVVFPFVERTMRSLLAPSAMIGVGEWVEKITCPVLRSSAPPAVTNKDRKSTRLNSSHL